MANNRIKGLTVEIGGDTSELTAALKSVDKASKNSSSELAEINRLLKLDPKNSEILAQKQKVLSEAIGSSKEKLELLRNAEKTAREQFEKGEIGEDQMRALQREIVYAENKLKKLEEQYTQVETAADEAGSAIAQSGSKSQEAAKDADVLDKKLDDLKGSYADAKESAKGAAMELGAGFAAAGAVVVAGVSSALKYEDALISIQTQTGATAEEMDAYRKAMEGAFSAGAGEDLDDVAGAMALIAQQTKETDPAALQGLTENALAVRKAFGFEVAEQLRAVNMLMQQFGLSSAQAYDLIVTGAQNGLNKNGDLLDVINEYSVHYKQLGYDAEGFFSSLLNGAATGVFSVDKLGDAMKEFGIRTKDNTASTMEAYALLHLDAEEMLALFAQGGHSAQQASDTVLRALWAMDDKVAQNQAGVALFGTMWEDLGADAIRALTDTHSSLKDVEGAMDAVRSVQYSSVTHQWEQLGRTAQTELIQPIGEDLLPVAKKFLTFSIEHFNKLIPTAKTLGTMIGAVFIVNKAAAFIKSIKTLTTAYKALKASITAANAAQSSSIWGMIATAIALVTSAIVSSIHSQKEAARTAQELRAELKAAADEQLASYRELSDAEREAARLRKETAKAIDQECGRYKDLWAELETLVDAEGKVLEGNEERVEFILSELSAAIGEEIELTDGQIKKYQELGATIDEVLLKQKVSRILTNQEGEYEAKKTSLPETQAAYEEANAAWLKYQEYTSALASLPAEIAAASAEMQTLGNEAYALQKDAALGYVAQAVYEAKQAEFESKKAEYSMLLQSQKEMESWLLEHANAEAVRAETLRTYDEARDTIAKYESLETAYFSGDTSAMQQAYQDYGYGMLTADAGASFSSLLQQAQELADTYNTLLGQSQNEGTTVSQEQVDLALEDFYSALFEAYQGAKEQEDPSAAIGQLAPLIYEQLPNADIIMRHLENGLFTDFDAFMNYINSFLTEEQKPQRNGASPAAVSAEPYYYTPSRFAAEDPAAYLARVMQDSPLFAQSGQPFPVEDPAAKENAAKLDRLLYVVSNLDLTVELDGDVLTSKLIARVDSGLGHNTQSSVRGDIK